MPRFLVDTSAATIDIDTAIALAAQRFPEVAIEQCYSDHDGPGAHLMWVCRAPSASHIIGWAAAAGWDRAAVRHVDIVARTSQARHPDDERGTQSRIVTTVPPCPDAP